MKKQLLMITLSFGSLGGLYGSQPAPQRLPENPFGYPENGRGSEYDDSKLATALLLIDHEEEVGQEDDYTFAYAYAEALDQSLLEKQILEDEQLALLVAAELNAAKKRNQAQWGPVPARATNSTRPASEEENECTICMDEKATDLLKVDCCKKVICNNCWLHSLNASVKGQCPFCRKVILGRNNVPEEPRRTR